MRECLDQGNLQSYFDGELSSERMERATSHLASCSTCSAAARELERENNLLATALGPEFEAVVPTERLRHRVDAAIAGFQLVSPNARERHSAIRGWVQSLSDFFTFTPRWVFAYAGLVVVFASVFAVIYWRQAPAVSQRGSQAAEPSGPNNPSVAVRQASPEAVVVAVSSPVPETSHQTARKPPVRSQIGSDNKAVARVRLLPGERSYLKTIAALDSTIKSDANRPMRPSLQAEYQRNLELVDRALAAARNAAKSNPNDPDTAEFMFTAYQSKVDLLNTVADARLYNRQH